MAGGDSLPSARHVLPSPDGSVIATLQRSSLLIHSTVNKHLIQAWSLPQELVTRCTFMRWSRPPKPLPNVAGEEPETRALGSSRLLLGDTENICVFDVADPTWRANITDVASNLGKIAEVAFGYTVNEIIVFSDFGVKVTIWSLLSSRGVEIKDPKYSVPCYDFRPHTGHMALLTRGAAQDVMMFLKPRTYEALRSVELGTVDAQGLSWSPDGNWIAVREAASAGHKVLIYTADGHLLKTFAGVDDPIEVGLGVKCVEWSPAGTLLIGDYNGNITVLSKGIFSPVTVLRHEASINVPSVTLWEEQISIGKERSYRHAIQPASPPSSASLTNTSGRKQGISIIACNSVGDLVAVRNDAVPTTAWIWSLRNGKLVTALIHHAPIKQLTWHSKQQDLILIHCATPDPAIHLWKSNWDPIILTLPMDKPNGRLEANWLQSTNDESYRLMLSATNYSTTIEMSSTGEIIPAASAAQETFKCSASGPEDMFDEGNSLELSPIKFDATAGFGTLNDTGSGFEMADNGIDDTFHYRKQVRAT